MSVPPPRTPMASASHTPVASAFRRKWTSNAPVASAFRRKSTASTSIDRRDFLKATVASPFVLRSARQDTSGAPVVVVGAGLAGLRAADLLRKAGKPVVVLE